MFLPIYLEYHNQWGNKKALYTLQSFILSCYYGISMKIIDSELFLSLYHEIGSLYKWLVILCLPSGLYRELGALWS